MPTKIKTYLHRPEILIMGSVFCFSVGDLLTRVLTAAFAYTVYLALRCLFGAFFTHMYVHYIKLTFGDLIFYFSNPLFYMRCFLWIATLLFYAVAFSRGTVSDIYIIVAALPLFIFTIDSLFGSAEFKINLLPPMLLAVIGVSIPIAQRILLQPNRSQIEGNVYLITMVVAFFAVLFHAFYFKLTKSLQENSRNNGLSNKAYVFGCDLTMFYVGALVLGVIYLADSSIKILPGVRAYRLPLGSEYIWCLASGFLFAAGIVLSSVAFSKTNLSRLALYENTSLLWALLFDLGSATLGDKGLWPIIIWKTIGMAIVAMAIFWFEKQKMKATP